MAVYLIVDVIDTVIVGVHVHLNDTVRVIVPFDDLVWSICDAEEASEQLARSDLSPTCLVYTHSGGDHDQGVVPVHVHVSRSRTSSWINSPA